MGLRNEAPSFTLLEQIPDTFVLLSQPFDIKAVYQALNLADGGEGELSSAASFNLYAGSNGHATTFDGVLQLTGTPSDTALAIDINREVWNQELPLFVHVKRASWRSVPYIEDAPDTAFGFQLYRHLLGIASDMVSLGDTVPFSVFVPYLLQELQEPWSLVCIE